MILSKVSRKWLVSIPAEVRETVGLEEGDYLLWEVRGDEGVIVVRPVKNPFKTLKGKYDDKKIVYGLVEEEADKILEGMVKDAGNRA